mmetsp:Transcript_10124/g.12172  ORF Transcript_10124/g.12172 Transcript_10124/m.12172 type:complete len:370 (-) Transcript_10124:60-1169(-)
MAAVTCVSVLAALGRILKLLENTHVLKIRMARYTSVLRVARKQIKDAKDMFDAEEKRALQEALKEFENEITDLQGSEEGEEKGLKVLYKQLKKNVRTVLYASSIIEYLDEKCRNIEVLAAGYSQAKLTSHINKTQKYQQEMKYDMQTIIERLDRIEKAQQNDPTDKLSLKQKEFIVAATYVFKWLEPEDLEEAVHNQGKNSTVDYLKTEVQSEEISLDENIETNKFLERISLEKSENKTFMEESRRELTQIREYMEKQQKYQERMESGIQSILDRLENIEQNVDLETIEQNADLEAIEQNVGHIRKRRNAIVDLSENRKESKPTLSITQDKISEPIVFGFVHSFPGMNAKLENKITRRKEKTFIDSHLV